MKAVYLVASLFSGLLAATSAPANQSVAQLKQIHGSVLVNTGDTYKSAREGMNLYIGDRLMSLEDSSMMLVYGDGCVAQFKENQIITVSGSSNCEGGAAYVEQKWPRQADPMVAEARRPPQGAYGYNYGYEGPRRVNTWAYVAGGAALFGLGYYIGTDSDDSDDDDEPISGF